MASLYVNPEIFGWYLITNVFTTAKEEYYLDQISKDTTANICHQIHKAKEFGWKFVPVEKKTEADYLGQFPEWLKEIWENVHQVLKTHLSFFPKYVMPDHVLLNEYEPGDGCKSHIDDVSFWNDWVVGVSFGSGCVMRIGGCDMFIPQRSVYVLSGDARYNLGHGIDFVKTDEYYGDVIERSKRTSLTFRTIHNDFLDERTKQMAKISL